MSKRCARSSLLSCLPERCAAVVQIDESDAKAVKKRQDAIGAKLTQLNKSFLRVLLPPLLTGLYNFTGDLAFVDRVLPSGVKLLQAFDALAQVAAMKSYLTPFEDSFLEDEDSRLLSYCKTLAVGDEFQCPNCEQKCDFLTGLSRFSVFDRQAGFRKLRSWRRTSAIHTRRSRTARRR